jgi:uncharacterized protein with HEPN domain
MPPNDFARIRHMIDATRQCLEYGAKHTLEDVRHEPPLQHLFLRNIEILGEAASKVSEDYRRSHPEIPWRDIIDMRNRIAHGYFDLNLRIVWDTVQTDLPKLLPLLVSLSEMND